MTVFTAVTLTVLVSMRHISVAHSKAERDASTDAFSFVEERLSGREETWANNAKPYVDRRFRELMRKWFRAELKAGLMTGIVFNTNAFMFRAGSAIALAVGAYLFLSGPDHHRHRLLDLPLHKLARCTVREHGAAAESITEGDRQLDQNLRAVPSTRRRC